MSTSKTITQNVILVKSSFSHFFLQENTSDTKFQEKNWFSVLYNSQLSDWVSLNLLDQITVEYVFEGDLRPSL